MPRSGRPSTFRLVIRAEIIPEKTPPSPVRQHSKRRTLVLAVGAVAVLALGWAAITVFRADPASAPVAHDEKSHLPVNVPAPDLGEAAPVVSDGPLPQPATSTAETPSAAATTSIEPDSTQAQPVQSPIRDEQAALPEPVNQIVPEPPPSALQTIQGTVRVSIRVTVDTQGKVVAVTPVDAGPSRYFERLSMEASRKWTFAPADTQEQRKALLRFAFTRDGATARAGN